MNSNLQHKREKLLKPRIYILIFLIITTAVGIISVVGQGQNTVSEKQYKPELVVQTGHSEQIESVVYSPDGKYIASGGGTEVKLWDIATGKEIKTFKGHISIVDQVIFSPNGKMLASVDAGDQAKEMALVKIWNVISGRAMTTIELAYTPQIVFGRQIAFSPDNKQLAISGFEGISLRDVATGKKIKEFTKPVDQISFEDFYSVAFSPDGKQIAGGTENSVVFFDVSNGKVINNWKVQNVTESYLQGVEYVEFSADGKTVITSGQDNFLKIWNVEDGTEVKRLALKSEYETQSIMLSHNRKLLAGISRDEEKRGELPKTYVKLWDIESGQELMNITLDSSLSGTMFSQIAFSPDDKKFAVTEARIGLTVGVVPADFTIRDISTGQILQKFNSNSSENTSIAFSPDSKKIIGSGSLDGSMNLWNLETGISYTKLEGHITRDGVGTPVTKVTFSPDSKKIATEGQYAPIKIWDIEKGQLLQTIDTISWINSKVFSSDGRGLYVFDNEITDDKKDRVYKFWDIKSGKVTRTIKSNLVSTESILVSPDGRLLVGIGSKYSDADPDNLPLSENSYIEIIDIKSGQIINEFSAEEGEKYWSDEEDFPTKLDSALALSPDGNFMAGLHLRWTSGVGVGHISYASLWDLRTGKLIRIIENPDTTNTIKEIVFSPDNKVVANVDHRNTIKFIDVQTGREIKYEKLPEWLEFNSDEYALTNLNGRKIQATPDSGKIILFEANTKKEIVSLISLNEKDWAVVTPVGLFDATDNAQKAMHFVVSDAEIGFEIIELEQLKSNYFVPNLFEKILRGDKLSKVDDLTVTLSPGVEVEYSKNDLSVLNLKLKNRGGGIGRVEIRINGSELTGNALAEKTIDKNLAEYNLPVKIPPELLRVGKNSVEIITWNKADYFRSRKNEFPIYKDSAGEVRGVETFIPDKEKQTKPPNFYAIVAGVSDYVGDKFDLRFAAKDAEDMSLALALGARKLFCGKEITQKKPCEKVHMRLLTTEKDQPETLLDITDFQRSDPVKANFQKVFTEVAEKAQPEDIVIIYLAGHGAAITSPEATEKSAFPDLYLYGTSETATLDVNLLRNKSIREATMLSSLELADWMKKITADKKALILDTCAAGAVQKDLTAKVRAEDAEKVRALDRLRERTGFYVLMGSAADAVSYESSSYRQGLLTYSLMEAMTNDSKLRDGKFIDIQTWFANSVERVEVLAEGIGGIQKPRLFSSNFARSFDVGEISKEEQLKIPLAQSVPVILEPELREEGKRTDGENLTDKLKSKLREFSYTVKRGEINAINYVDAANAVNGLSPRGSYKIDGNNITVEIDLIRNEKEFARINFVAERETVVDRMLEEIVKATQKN